MTSIHLNKIQRSKFIEIDADFLNEKDCRNRFYNIDLQKNYNMIDTNGYKKQFFNIEKEQKMCVIKYNNEKLMKKEKMKVLNLKVMFLIKLEHSSI